MKMVFTKSKPQAPIAAKKQQKPTPEKRRSDKEIGLLYLRARLNEALENEFRGDAYKSHADGRRLKDKHIEKIDDFLKRKIEKILTPIDKLLTKRGLL